MRIKANNQLSSDVQTLDFGSAYALTENSGDVTLTGAGITPFTQPHPRRLPYTVFTNWQAGHGWTNSGTGSFNLNDTSTYLFGSQGVSITTNGAGASSYVQKTAFTAIDLSASILKLWVKVDDVSTLLTISVLVSSDLFVNYSNVTAMDATSTLTMSSGEWYEIAFDLRNKSAVTGAPNNAAITALRVQVADNSTGPCNVHLGGLAYQAQQTAFPNGVVSVVLDDSLASQYTTARPKLDQYGYPATAYTIVDALGTSGFMTLAQLTELHNLHGWEVGGHAYAKANHDNDFFGSSPTADTDLSQLKQWLSQNGFEANNYAYPHGTINVVQTAEAAAKKYFSSARTTMQQANRQCLPPTPVEQYRLRIFQCGNTTTTGAIQTEIDNAFTAKTWLILLFHDIVTSPVTTIQFSTANFSTVIDYLNTKGIPVRRVSDVMAALA